jgi:tRNA modification GTPase
VLAERGSAKAPEILAEDLRHATECLDEITGATATEALLDRIFARFCLGK